MELSDYLINPAYFFLPYIEIYIFTLLCYLEQPKSWHTDHAVALTFFSFTESSAVPVQNVLLGTDVLLM